MWFKQLGILLTLYGVITGDMLDISHLCNGIRSGDAIPNPFDCQSYFICDTIPTLRFCDDGFHFDGERKMCNSPANANCRAPTGVVAITIAPPPSEQQSVGGRQPTSSPPSSAAGRNSTRPTPSSEPNWWGDTLRPQFVAIDVETGEKTDPMAKYDPSHIECHHYGAYFMPHPTDCRRYFLCAYGHLHQHRCGRGVMWNYRTQVCDLDDYAECYSRAANTATTTTTTTTTTTLTSPATTQQRPTVCFVLDGSTTTLLTTEIPSASTPRGDGAGGGTIDGLQCPPIGNRQAYLPHAKDCSKYYICILGQPVLTSCPRGLYWDQRTEFCDLAPKVQCYKPE